VKKRFPTTPRAAYATVRVAAERRRNKAIPAVPMAGLLGPPPVNCVIFSKDRPMQLDACLRSIDRFEPYAGPITVIYQATSSDFETGYALLMESAADVEFIEQSSFEDDVLTATDGELEYTVFHTDDDVFYRGPPAPPLPAEGFAAFSLRLGANTTYCYSSGSPQPLPPFSRHSPFLGWNWNRAEHDFAYPMSLDGHVFRTPALQELLRGARFGNPNELEEELHLRRHRMPSWLLSFEQSCLVSIPLNIVSSTHANRASKKPELSPLRLNDRFLAGERIALESIDASSICAAHQELPLKFEARDAQR